ncbi:MAG: Cell division protein ftsA [Candidatus Moranbacteria bacterium GW2011_GWF2_36_839]|nr:MAG: Cell division protein ftsA [Candidatus Moranbacteria bacterium GW2011_GWF1_36_78]KKQ17305.1 MAG: Cell division protein ftsA [Candidatus Moranbacteria bacterium GW2011_GWF2_36_839]HAT73850.1 cell division protein FtsA [Candidatus Moranbacteria bacterium]HBY11007.1 cell division protein FtsA [Candidatus Moranbacteria bacterium]
MSRKNIICGIDVGSSSIRTVITQIISPEEKPRIIGVGTADSLGVRKGVIVNIEETLQAVNESLEKAERTAGITIDRAIVSIGGNHISSQYSKGVIAVGRADGEVTQDDIERVIGAAQAISIPPNREIIHIIPKNYSLDDQKNIKDPLGMNGVRLEADTLIIEGATPYIKNLSKCFDQAKIEVENFVLAPLASAKATLTKRQKELGVVLVDIGGGTTSVAVFEEDDLIASVIIPVGGNHITNDIAIGLRTSIDVAERVKIEFGSAIPREIGKKEDINLAEIDSSEEGIVSRHHVAEIIEARLEEIFTLVNKELKLIGKEKLLPAGAVLTGGTSKLPGAVDLAKEVLGLPAQTGFPSPLGGLVDKVDDPSFTTVIGLVLWGIEANESGGMLKSSGRFMGNITNGLGGKAGNIKRWVEKFLP